MPRWNAEWLEEFPWSRPVEGHPHKVFCHSCRSDFSCERGKHELKRHHVNSKHINNELNKPSDSDIGPQVKKGQWKAEWLEEFPWSGPVEANPQRVFCHSCQSDFGCDHGSSELKRHQLSSKHIYNEFNKTSKAENDPQSFPSKKEFRTSTTFDCKKCGKEFSQFRGLKGHFRIHSGEKPFKCTYCVFMSGYKNALKDHIRIIRWIPDFPYLTYQSKLASVRSLLVSHLP